MAYIHVIFLLFSGGKEMTIVFIYLFLFFFFFNFWPYHEVCRILVPNQRLNLDPWRCELRVLTTGPPGDSYDHSFECRLFYLKAM